MCKILIVIVFVVMLVGCVIFKYGSFVQDVLVVYNQIIVIDVVKQFVKFYLLV